MRKPGIAFLVLLVASSAAVPTRAPAAPLSPAGFAAGAVPSQYLRVQYGGGDDDDEPSYQPQHSHQHSNFGSGNGNAIAGLIAGVATMAIREGIKQKQINAGRQQQQIYQQQTQRQQQARKQNQRQAAQQRRNNEAQVAKQKREEARANEKHQEEVDDLNKQKRELAQLKKDIENQKAEQNKPAGYPPPDNNPAGNTETYENKTDSKDDVVFNIIPYRSNDPDPGTIKVGPLTLYPNRIDFPPDRTICTGTTAKGCFLRLMPTPSAGGGSRQECYLYCKQPTQKVVVIEPTPTPRYPPPPPPTPPTRPPRYVEPDPTPTPTPRYIVPYPTPTPYVEPYPTPTPTPRYVVPYPTPTPTPRYVEPYPTPTPTPRYVEPYPTPTPTPTVKLIYGVDTDKAEDYEEPKRPAKPAVVTDKAEDYEEPKRPAKPAVVTDKAEDYEEPKRPAKPAVDTDKAEDYEEPKRPAKPAVFTDKAEDYEEPKRRLTPAVDTDKAEDYEEPKRRLTLAVDTDKAEDYEERKRTLTPAVETEKATDSKEPERTDNKVTDNKVTDNKVTDNKVTHDKTTDDKKKPAGGGGEIDEAERINPVECPNLNLSGCGARFRKQGEEAEKKREEEKKIAREEKKKRDDEIARKKKEDEENKFAIEHPGDLDSKKCTAHGDIPVKTLLTKGNYQQLVDTVLGSPTRPDDGPTRTVVTSGLKAIPEVGSLVSGVVSALWKDPANDEMFKALVSYVDALVPDSITKERVAQMKDELGGLWDNLNSYLNEKDLYQKGLDLKLLNNTLEQMRKKFFNDRTEPEKQLALVVAFGTLRLLALKEQILHQDEYYPGHPSSLAVSSMNTAVTQFAKLAADMKSKIIERRLAKLRVEAGA